MSINEKKLKYQSKHFIRTHHKIVIVHLFFHILYFVKKYVFNNADDPKALSSSHASEDGVIKATQIKAKIFKEL